MERVKKVNERRRKSRFPIERELRYKIADRGVVVATGSGRTQDIGSGGVAFTAERQLTPGDLVELSVSWPALISDTCAMRLVVFGRILRCNGVRAVTSIDKYEFRTQARTFHTLPARSDGMLQRWAGLRKDNIRTMAGV
jgi:hypothetical protein